MAKRYSNHRKRSADQQQDSNRDLNYNTQNVQWLRNNANDQRQQPQYLNSPDNQRRTEAQEHLLLIM